MAADQNAKNDRTALADKEAVDLPLNVAEAARLFKRYAEPGHHRSDVEFGIAT
jgi:hypothetical protein